MRALPVIRTSKRPHCSCLLLVRANNKRTSAFAGSRVSACKNTNISPWAIAAPAFICRARPRSERNTEKPAKAHASPVPSSLPPSTINTSHPLPRQYCRCAIRSGNSSLSLSTGTIIEIVGSCVLLVMRGPPATEKHDIAYW